MSGSDHASPRLPAPEAATQQPPSTAPPVLASPAGPSADVRPLDVALLRVDPDLPVPAYGRPGDAGVDLACTVDVELAPGERALVGTGVAVALPPGHAGFVHPRSGLAARLGLSIVNAPGTVDAGYRGEIRVCLINLGQRPVTLRRGDRVAQLVVQRVEQVRFIEVAELPGSARGSGGHGSTGGHGVLTGGAPTDGAPTDGAPTDGAR